MAVEQGRGDRLGADGQVGGAGFIDSSAHALDASHSLSTVCEAAHSSSSVSALTCAYLLQIAAPNVKRFYGSQHTLISVAARPRGFGPWKRRDSVQSGTGALLLEEVPGTTRREIRATPYNAWNKTSD